MSFFEGIKQAIIGLIARRKPISNDTITINSATFTKERMRKIEDEWVRDGLIR